MAYLSGEQKEAAHRAVENATTVDEVEKALSDATAKKTLKKPKPMPIRRSTA